MGTEFIVPTGDIIKEYLTEYGISQKDLSAHVGMSEKHISNVLSGKARLMEDFALRLEYVFKEIPASYWLNYESRYREYIAREKTYRELANNNDLSEIGRRFSFDEVFGGLGWDLPKQAHEMLKLLNISSFDNFNKVYGKLNTSFMEDGGAIEPIAVWLKLCEEQIELQNDKIDIEYDPKIIESYLGQFKALALSKSIESITVNCRKLCNRLGIYLVVYPTITNSKVRGAIETFNGHPAIFLSGRFKTHDNIWFAFFHELGHLIYHYDKHYESVSMEADFDDIEEVANHFARDVLISHDDYSGFIARVDGRVPSKKEIEEFALLEGVLPGIVVARLQHDGYLPYSRSYGLKNKINIK